MQNLPAKGEKGNQIRSLFTAVPGKKLVGIDVDQFQMRILAWYLNHMLPDEPTARILYDEFNNNPECDPHSVTAKILFGHNFSKDQRKAAKTINFGFLFGLGIGKMARQLTISIAEAKQLMNTMKRSFPALPMLKELVVNNLYNAGTVYTIYGRRGVYPDIHSKDKGLQSCAARQAFNFIIQGTEADIMKMAETQVWNMVWDYGIDAKFVIQCHDEFVYECDEYQSPLLIEIMNQIINSSDWLPGLKVTGSAKIGDNWMEIH
jgi:DNA polymerase-1